MPSASQRTRRIGGFMLSVGHSTTVRLLSGIRISFRWATKLIRSMTVRRRSLFSSGRRARRAAKAFSKGWEGGRIPEKLGSDKVVSEGGFRNEGSSRGPDGCDGPFPPGVRANTAFSSIDFRAFVSVSIAASKYGLRAWVRMGSGTIHVRI
jgi:hypothetical protein